MTNRVSTPTGSRSLGNCGFNCFNAGRSNVAGLEAKRVTAGFDGAATTIGIDPESGRILATRYRGRGGPRSLLGKIERRCSDYRDFGGSTIRYSVRTATFDDAAFEADPTSLAKIEVNPKLDVGAFRNQR